MSNESKAAAPASVMPDTAPEAAQAAGSPANEAAPAAAEASLTEAAKTPTEVAPTPPTDGPAAAGEVAAPDLPMSLGARLKAAREAKGISVADAAARLKWSARKIELLEAEQFASLPSGTHLRGLVRNYARLVGQDSEKMLAFLPATARTTQGELRIEKRLNAPFPQPTEASPADRGWLLVGLAALLIAGLYGLYAYFSLSPSASAPRASAAAPAGNSGAGGAGANSSGNPSTVVTPLAVPSASETPSASSPGAPSETPATGAAAQAGTVPATTGSEAAAGSTPAAATAPADNSIAVPVPEATATVAAAESPPAPPTVAGPSVLQMAFSGDSWVEVRDASGTLIHNRLHRNGDTAGVDGAAPFDLTIGNSRLVKLTYKGKPVPLEPHTRVSVARLKLN